MSEALLSRRSLAFGAALHSLVRERVGQVAEDALLDLPVTVTVTQLLEEIASPELEVRWHDMYTPGVKEATVSHRGDDGQLIGTPAARIDVRVPFTGDRELFDVRPSSFTFSPPSAQVDSACGELVLSLTTQQLSGDSITAFVDKQRRVISEYVGWVNADVRRQRAELEELITREVTARRERLLTARGVESAVGIPIRPTGSASNYPVPLRATRVRLTETAGRQAYQPEPELHLALYEDILGRVQGFRATLERSPRTFARLSEEELRDHLLLILNANYSGAAVGEAFNGNGKTDILMRHEDRNVFIAECKFWHGTKAFVDAVDQLLGYLVWRDSKAALIVFIRQKNVSDIVTKAIDALRAHPRYVSGGAGTDPSDRSDFILRAAEEGQGVRTIRVALIPVVVPGPPPVDEETGS